MVIESHTPWEFFDGSSQGAPTKEGAWGEIFLTQNHSLNFKVGTGPSRNNQSEIATLKLTLLLDKEKGLAHLQVMGDSQTMIKWMNGEPEWRNFL